MHALDAVPWFLLAVDVTADPLRGVDLLTTAVGSAVGAFLTTLAVGAVMVALLPDYTDRMKAAVGSNPVGSLVYGLVSLVFLVLVTIVLVVTIIGILVAVPLLVLAYLVWAVGSAIAFLAIGERIVGTDDGWLKPLAVGAGINGALTLSGIGALVAFCIGAAGFGAVLRDWND
jgi:hypothetical protein